MEMKVKVLDIEAGTNIALMSDDDARERGLFAADRVCLSKLGGSSASSGKDEKQLIAILDISSNFIEKGTIGIFSEAARRLGLKNDEKIFVTMAEKPASQEFIKKKMDKKELEEVEIRRIIEEMMKGMLSDIELSSFIASVYINGLTDNETIYLTDAIVDSGERLILDKHPIADKHCTGGVAGNRTTMIVVPIVAAAGAYIPKTSSRAITSAAGTADTMEVLAPVSLSIKELERVVLNCHGCMVWGGGLNLAAADDKLIKIRNPLRLDPRGMLLASILAKKKSVDAEYVVVDIPVGRGNKITNIKAAEKLAQDFLNIGSKLGMKIEVLLTDGNGPIGRGVGPALECRDVLQVMQGNGPRDLKDKSCKLAGALLELTEIAEKGRGEFIAKDILESGKAYAKLKEIIEHQGGNPDVRVDDLPIGSVKHAVKSNAEGRIQFIDNKIISKIARAAGAPKNKGAGIYLHVERGDKIVKEQVLFEIFAESEAKLDFALDVLKRESPIELEQFILKCVQ